MRTRSNAIFASIFGLSVLATIALFVIPKFVKDTPTEGKLSPETVKIEQEYKAIQGDWKANNEAFRARDQAKAGQLVDLQNRVKLLAKRAESAQATTKEEKEALLHLSASIASFSSVIVPYVLLQMAPEKVSPRMWDKKNEDMKAAEREWDAWTSATATMSR